MKPRTRVSLTLLTHGLAIAAGWAIYRTEVAPRSGPSPETTAVARPTKSVDRPRAVDGNGEDILAKVLKEVKQETPREYHPGTDTRIFEVSQDIRDRIDSIEIPADFTVALEEILASTQMPFPDDQKASLIALSYQWIDRDPVAFFQWAGGNDDRRKRFFGVLFNVDMEIYRRSGSGALLDLVGKAGNLASQVSGDLGRVLVNSGNIRGIEAAANRMEPAQRRTFLMMAGLEWPDNKRAELTRFALECDQPGMLIAHYANRINSGGELWKMMEDPSLPEDFRAKLAADPQLRNILINDPEVPWETRLRFGANPFQMAHNDVSNLLNKDRDWAFAFRKGEATADEILAMVTAGTPGLAEREPAALRMQVFRELAEENPAKAMGLLKDLPEAQRDEEVLFVSRTHFDGVEPDKFLELLRQVPADTPEQWESRLDTWNRRSFTNNERLQDGYVEWVQTLPPGLDRDMACYSLARAVNESNPPLAASLRGEVVDTKLQQRIAKHR